MSKDLVATTTPQVPAHETFGGESHTEQGGIVQTIFIFLVFHLLYLLIPVLIICAPVLCFMSSDIYIRSGGIIFVLLYATTFDGKHKKSGAPWPDLVNLPIVKTALDWLPIVLRRTSKLNPEQLYIFACHPHGTLAFNRGGVGFSTHTLWDRAFPGVKFRVLTATAAFFVPFIREMWLWSFCVDASKPTAVNVLKNDRCSLFLYPGGEREQLETIQGEHRVFLKSRKGFVKLALEQGAHLVPVYAFGETDLYAHSQALINFRKWLVRKWGVAIPFLSGEYGLMPFRCRVTLVFGTPIDVAQVTHPTHAQVDELHARYVNALYCLFEEHKHDLGFGQKHLEIL